MAVQVITWVSLALCVSSFVLFAYFSFAMPSVKQGDTKSALSEMAQLVEALAKLTESFAKAGPAVMSLVASIFFLLIAALGAGLGNIAAAR